MAADFLAGNIEKIHARMDATAAAQLPASSLQTAFDEMAAQAPLRGPDVDRAVQLSPEERVYQAELDWGGETVAMSVALNESSEITGISLSPQPALPYVGALGEP